MLKLNDDTQLKFFAAVNIVDVTAGISTATAGGTEA